MKKNTHSFQVHMNILQDRSHARPQNKISLNKLKIEIVSSIFSDHDKMKLEITYEKKKNCIKHKRREIKQYTTKQPVGH